MNAIEQQILLMNAFQEPIVLPYELYIDVYQSLIKLGGSLNYSIK